jgi:NADH-ubiquinone oxidoreductase chain 5
MYLTLIIFPLLGSISSGFFGRKIGLKGSHLLTCSFVLITTIFSIMSFFEVGFNNIAVGIKLSR